MIRCEVRLLYIFDQARWLGLMILNNQLKTFERAVSEGENGLHDVAHSMLVMISLA